MTFGNAVKAERAIRHHTSQLFYGKPINECN